MQEEIHHFTCSFEEGLDFEERTQQVITHLSSMKQ